MTKKITTLIFDFDGVIANTDVGRYKLLKDILPNYDEELSNNFHIKDLIGLSTKAFLIKYSKNLKHNEIDEIVQKRYELYFSDLSKYCIPFDNLKETINYLSSLFELVVVTTNSLKNVTLQLEHLQVLKYFIKVIGREKSEINYIKSYKTIPIDIGKKVSECIVIEDSDIGVTAARNAGFFCIRFDPDNIFSKGVENERVKNYLELIDKIKKNTSR